MVAKLTSLTHKIAIEMHLVAESCTICSSCSMRPVRKLLDTRSYSNRFPSSSSSSYRRARIILGIFDSIIFSPAISFLVSELHGLLSACNSTQWQMSGCRQFSTRDLSSLLYKVQLFHSRCALLSFLMISSLRLLSKRMQPAIGFCFFFWSALRVQVSQPCNNDGAYLTALTYLFT